MKPYYLANHLILDIETLGLDKDSVITEVGFAFITDLYIKYKYSFMINPIQQIVLLKSSVDKSTLNWYNDTFSPDYIQQLCKDYFNKSIDIEEAGEELSERLNLIEEKWGKIDYFWGNSPDFDYGILSNFINRVDEYYNKSTYLPWGNFWQYRDFRTIKGTRLGEDFKNENPHSAIHDALYEANVLLSIFKKLKQNDLSIHTC